MKQLKNLTEEIVVRFVNTRLSEYGVCDCEDCRLDVMAIMLNNLPSHYAVTETGALFAQLKQMDYQHTVDVAVAMAEAVETVRKKPRHVLKIV